MHHTAHRHHTGITSDHTGSHSTPWNTETMEPKDRKALPVPDSGKHAHDPGTSNDPESHARKRTYPSELFRSPSEYKRHKLTHTGEKMYSCEYCGKAMKLLSSLRRHLRIKHGPRKPQLQKSNPTTDKAEYTERFGCNYCGKAFAGHTSLKNHVRIHTGERPYSCEYCGRAFTQKGNLKAHMVVHGGEKIYFCQYCGKSYTQGSSLNRHIKQNHLKNGKKGSRRKSVRRWSTPRPQNTGNVRKELCDMAAQSQKDSTKGVTAKIEGAVDDADGAIVKTEYVIVETEAATANTENTMAITGSAIGSIEGAPTTEAPTACAEVAIASIAGSTAHTQYVKLETGAVMVNTDDAIAGTEGAIASTEGAISSTAGAIANTQYVKLQTGDVMANTDDAIASTEGATASTEGARASTAGAIANTQYVKLETGAVMANTGDAIAITEGATASTEGAIPNPAGAIVKIENVLTNPSIASSVSLSETCISQGTSKAAVPMEEGSLKSEMKAMFIDLSLQLSQVSNKLRQDNALPPFSFKLLYSQLTGQELET